LKSQERGQCEQKANSAPFARTVVAEEKPPFVSENFGCYPGGLLDLFWTPSSAETSGRRAMKSHLQLLIALTTVGWVGAGMASETRVVINLSEQRAYLIEQGRVALVSPIASGKPGWPTPTGDFRIFNKDIEHRSRSFGSVLDHWGRVVNSNATPGSHVPPGGHYRPAAMP